MLSYQLHNSHTGAAFYQHKLLFSDIFVHGFFTRKGGISIGDYAGLNCSFFSGDLLHNVNYNRQIIKKTLIHENCELVTLNQIHGNKVIIINSGNIDNAIQPVSGFKADGLVTRKRNILLGILTADCAPILMADKSAGVIGACHAGWKGAISGIIENTVLEMCKLGACADNICCVIGPAIAQQSYEVDADFRENILVKNKLAHKCFFPDVVSRKANSDKKFLFDLHEYCKIELKRLCVDHYANINKDTYQNRELFYSYRLSYHEGKSKHGRQISIIGIK